MTGLNIRDIEPEPHVVPLSYDGSEMLSFDLTKGGGGWAAYAADGVGFGAPLSAYLRIGPESAKPGSAWEIRELQFVVRPEGRGFSASVLREIPVTRIEAAVNQVEHREALARVVAPFGAIELPISGTRFRFLKPEPVKVRRTKPRIADPGGYRKPDEFYRQVAEKFLALAAMSNRPAQDMADANNHMPVATVHRWIREAKTRGLLPLPSHRGDG